MDQRSLRSVKLIVGLGNPGAEYQKTYHNAGALFLRAFADAAQSPVVWKKAPRFSYARVGSHILVTPSVFMNESGSAVLAARKRFTIHPEEILIVHDESDLPLGEFRFSFGRGPAGHRGASSVITSLGTKNFWRLRIGVRSRPGKAGAFVLRPMSASDAKALYSACAGAIEMFTVNETP